MNSDFNIVHYCSKRVAPPHSSKIEDQAPPLSERQAGVRAVVRGGHHVVPLRRPRAGDHERVHRLPGRDDDDVGLVRRRVARVGAHDCEAVPGDLEEHGRVHRHIDDPEQIGPVALHLELERSYEIDVLTNLINRQNSDG